MTSVRFEQARPATGVADLGEALLANLSAVIRGKDEALRLGVIALLSGGHLLVEDVPGVAKTLLAKAMAQSVGGNFRRLHGTPDLLPSDLHGVSVYQPGTGAWEFRAGPLFANVVLVDEVNRATPRTQAALLESMEEHQVSVDGATRKLPDPFFLVATQNPLEHAGTFPLPDGQLDRFAIVMHLGYADPASERDVLLGRGRPALILLGMPGEMFGIARTSGAGWVMVLLCGLVATLLVATAWPAILLRTVRLSVTAPQDATAVFPMSLRVDVGGWSQQLKLRV